MFRHKVGRLWAAVISFSLVACLLSAGQVVTAASTSASSPDLSQVGVGVSVASSGSLMVAGYRPVQVTATSSNNGLEAGGARTAGDVADVTVPLAPSITDVLGAVGLSSADAQKSFACLASYYATEPCGHP